MTTRTIRGKKYNIETILTEAIASVDGAPLNTTNAETYLRIMGHTDPAQSLISQVARDQAILAILDKQTGAAFKGQLGKIQFDDPEKALKQINAYLDRRNAGHRSRWGK